MTASVPALSIVIASSNAARSLDRCLRAIMQEPDAQLREVIVSDSSTDDTAALMRAFPSAQFLHTEAPRNLAQLRGSGIAAARGQVIALIDPYAIVAPGWQAAVLRAHDANDAPVIGGAVELDRVNERAWWPVALFINEYGMFMPPVQQGAADILPGCNLSYKREALFDGERPRYPVFWKTFVNWDVERGAAMWLSGDVVVTLHKSIPFAHFLVSRFHHGRSFAAMRSLEWSAVARMTRAMASPLLPAVLYSRWARVYWPKRRRRLQLVLTTPIQLLLFTSWAMGEFAGYAFGAGSSEARLTY